MNELEVTCFGRLCVRFAGEEVESIAVQKVQELFCYLLLYRQQPHHRDKLATILWAECSTAQAKTYLRKTLWQMRQALDAPMSAVGRPFLLSSSDWLQLNPEFPVCADVAIFEHAFEQVQSLSPPGISAAQRDAMEQAVHLYEGDFLEGWYQEWCLFERERLEFNYLRMLDKLLQQCEYEQNYDQGVAYGQLILQRDEAREQTHFRLMRLYYLAGQRTQALRQYQQCAGILLQELGVAPSQRTQALHRAIKTDNLLEIIAFNSNKPYYPPSLHKTLRHLQDLQRLLDDMQARVEEEIALVQQEL